MRQALFRRLQDEDVDVREEALVGLAKRKDLRILSQLIEELQQPSMTSRIVEAAHNLLGIAKDQAEWSAEDYVRALRERYPEENRSKGI